VEFLAFHEGRGHGKVSHPRGHIIVSQKRIVTGKRKVTRKNSYRKGAGSSFSHVTHRIMSEFKESVVRKEYSDHVA
jgi:hypothetical protein